MNNLKIGARLGFAFGLILLITVFIAVVGVLRLGNLDAASKEFATTQVERSTLAHQWEANIRMNWVRALASLRSSDPVFIDTFQKDMDATTKDISEI